MTSTSSSRTCATQDSSTLFCLPSSSSTTSTCPPPSLSTLQSPSILSATHSFLVGADASALPFYPSPRVVIASGPAPSEEQLKWHDQESYQTLLKKTTVRCVNILGITALQDVIRGSNPGLRLGLVEMHDMRIPQADRGHRGQGFYCCLFQDQVMLPKATVAVYLVDPFYSSSLLYRVKALLYDDDTPIVAREPEQILLALLARKMAAAQCNVGVITNGHLFIVCEAGRNNTLEASEIRILSEAYIDCSIAAGLEAQEGATTRPMGKALQKGFVRADMIFIWLAVAVHACHQYLRFSTTAEVSVRDCPALEESFANGDEGHSERQSPHPPPHRPDHSSEHAAALDNGEGVHLQTGNTAAGFQRFSQNDVLMPLAGLRNGRTSAKASRPAPAWLRAFTSRKSSARSDRPDVILSGTNFGAKLPDAERG